MKFTATEWFTIVKESGNELYGYVDSIHYAKILLDNMKEYLGKDDIKSRIEPNYLRDMYKNETMLVINGDEFDIESIKEHVSDTGLISSYLLYTCIIKSKLSDEEIDRINKMSKYFNIDF